MGNSDSCGNLHEYSNACEMYKCVDNVQGIASNSGSPSDTWIVEFKQGTNYEGKPIKKGFVKWFIDPYSLSESISRNQQAYINSLKGLNYEVRVYRDIIRPLIDYNICPNFVRYLGSSENCSDGQILTILIDNTYIESSNIKMSDRQANICFVRSVCYMINMFNERPSINNITDGITCNLPDIYTRQDANNLRFNLVVNEAVSRNSLTLHKWLSLILKNKNTTTKSNVWKVFFQVIAGCYAMSLCKMTHNDLHMNNIWVEKSDNKKVTYILNDQTYTFNTEYKVKIFDFDISYVERFGNNDLLNYYRRWNKFVPNKDMVHFLTNVYKYVPSKTILNALAPNNESRKWLIDLFESKQGHEFIKSNGHSVTTKELNNLRSPIEIVKQIGMRVEQDLLDTTVLSNNVFVCKPEMFDSNGKVKI